MPWLHIFRFNYIPHFYFLEMKQWYNCASASETTLKKMGKCVTLIHYEAGIILWMRPANERRRYIVTSSLIGWAHRQNDPWVSSNITTTKQSIRPFAYIIWYLFRVGRTPGQDNYLDPGLMLTYFQTQHESLIKSPFHIRRDGRWELKSGKIGNLASAVSNQLLK